MNTLTLTVVILVVYMAAMLLIGYMGRNKSENFKEFVTAAKKGSLLMVCGSYIGSHIGNGVVVGGAETAPTTPCPASGSAWAPASATWSSPWSWPRCCTAPTA